MKRNEKALVATTAFLIGLFAATLALGVAHWLNNQQWWADGANEIQWAGGLATFAGIGAIGWWYWQRRCGQPRCIRLGEHPVAKTRRKVCHHHHTVEHHRLVAELHRVEGKLGWGETHE